MPADERAPDRPSDPDRGWWTTEPLVAQYYGLILGLIVISFGFGIAASDERWGSFVYFILQAATLLVALRASEASRRTFRIALIVIALGVVLGTISAIVGTPRSDRIYTGGLSAILVLTTIVAIIRELRLHPHVSAHTVLGALCVYLLLGLLFAFLYQFNGALDKEPFFTNGQDGSASDYLYFSYVTLTTVGFGDLVAEGDIGRTFAVMEAVLGQLYLVTVVGFTVGLAAGRRNR